jgi:diguanylate cyclase (GGDEF)-like protein
MNLSPLSDLALVTPVILLCLAAAGALLWNSQRKHRYLLWLAGSQVLIATALTAQTLLRGEHAYISNWWVAALYIGAAIAFLLTMARRLGQPISPGPIALLATGVLASVVYFLETAPSLAGALTALSLGCAAILAYGVPRFARTPKRHALERWTLVLYVLCVLLTGIRPALLWGLQGDGVPASPMWWFGLLHLLVMSIASTLCLGGCALLDTIHTLRQERDYDSLTGVLNRRALEDACAPIPSSRGIVSLIALDLDHFKRINDRYGHPVGDEVLRQVGRILRDNVREGDIVARVGGEEFIIALYRQKPEHAVQLAQRIALTLQLASWGGRLPPSFQVTVSAGVVRVRLSETLAQAISRADALLYTAKRTGRNRVHSDKAVR